MFNISLKYSFPRTCRNVTIFLHLMVICVTVLREPWPLCTGSQGLPGLGYGPPVAAVWLPQAGKAIAGGLLPTVVGRDMTSYASYWTTGRWHVRCYITVYVIYWQYKSGCNPVLGSPFASPVAGDLSTPFSQLSHCNPLSRALAGHPWSFQNKLLGFELSLCYRVSTGWLNHRAALLQNLSGKCW